MSDQINSELSAYEQMAQIAPELVKLGDAFGVSQRVSAKAHSAIVADMQQEIEAQQHVIAIAKMLSVERGKDAKLSEKSLANLAAARKKLVDLSQDQLGIAKDINTVEAKQITDAIEVIDKMTKRKDVLVEIGKVIDKIPIVAQTRNLATLGGQIGLFVNAYKDAARQAGLWEQSNYTLYGSIGAMTRQVYDIRNGTSMLQAEAEAAAKAMADMAIDKDSFVEGTRAIGEFSIASGVGVDVAADYAKQMESISGSIKDLGPALERVRSLQAKYGLTGKDAGVMISSLTKNMRIFTTSSGDAGETLKSVSDRMMKWAAIAKKAGVATATVAQIFDSLNTSAMDYAVLLGGKLMSNDPAEMFAEMTQNSGKFVDQFEKLPLAIRDSISKSVTGLGFKELKELDRVYFEAAQSLGHFKGMTYDKVMADEQARAQLRAMTIDSEKFAEIQDIAAEKTRLADNAERQWGATLDNLKQTIVLIVGPLVTVVGWLAKFTNEFLAAHPVIKYTTGAVVLLALAFKGLGGSILGLLGKSSKLSGIFDWIKGTKVGEVATGTFKKIGDGIKGFIKTIGSIPRNTILKSALVITILIAALAGLVLVAWLIKTSGVSVELLYLGGVMIAFVGMMWAASKILDKAQDSMIKGAVSMAILGAAMIPMAIAMSFLKGIDPGLIIVFAIAVAILGVTMAILAGAAGPMITAAVALAVLGVALLLIAGAIYVVAMAFDLFAKIPWVEFGKGLLSFGYSAMLAGPMMLIGFIAMAAALLIGASMIMTAPIFWLASMFIGWGLSNIMNAIGGGNVAGAAANIQRMLQGIAVGADAIAASSYKTFWWASKFIGAGLSNIFNAFEGRDIGNITGMIAAIQQLTSLGGLKGLDQLEEASRRIADSISRIAGSVALMKWVGLDSLIRTSAAVTVKNDLTDRRKEENDRAYQSDMLKSIKDGISDLNEAVEKIVSGTVGDKTIEQIEAIKRVLSLYLPEIAERDKGLSAATNQW